MEMKKENVFRAKSQKKHGIFDQTISLRKGAKSLKVLFSFCKVLLEN